MNRTFWLCYMKSAFTSQICEKIKSYWSNVRQMLPKNLQYPQACETLRKNGRNALENVKHTQSKERNKQMDLSKKSEGDFLKVINSVYLPALQACAFQ